MAEIGAMKKAVMLLLNGETPPHRSFEAMKHDITMMLLKPALARGELQASEI